MLKSDEIEGIRRYIKKVESPDEGYWIESLFNDGEQNQSLKLFLEDDWNRISDVNNKEDNSELSAQFNKILHLIRVKNGIPGRNYYLRKLVTIYMRIAAILLIPLFVGGIILFYLFDDKPKAADQVSNATIYAPSGSRVSFILPDSTKGMLNSGSFISYNLPFINKRVNRKKKYSDFGKMKCSKFGNKSAVFSGTILQ